MDDEKNTLFSSDLIDLSDNSRKTESSDSGYKETTDQQDSSSRPFIQLNLDDYESKYDLDDYVRKPRVYDRSEFAVQNASKNDDKPPPLPPKRRSQSRKNIKLRDRLKSAGVEIGLNNGKVGSQSVTRPKSMHDAVPLIPTPSNNDYSWKDFDDTSKSSLKSLTPAANANVISIPNPVKDSYPGVSPTQAQKNSLEKANEFRQSQSFEARLESAMRQQSNVDLITQNLVEFEIMSKPVEQKPKSPTRVTSWNDLLCPEPSRISAASLSVEDLEAFLSTQEHVGSLESDNNFEVSESFASIDHTDHVPSGTDSGMKRTGTLPPKRPPLPKSFKRFSLPVELNSEAQPDSTLYFGDGIFDLTEERNEEAVAFCKYVAELRKIYKFNDAKTNPGVIPNPLVMCSMCDFIQPLQIHVYFETSSTPTTIYCNALSRMDEVVSKSLLVFQNTYRDIDTISNNMYIFKVCGESSYLEGNEVFIHYEYVQNCVKLDQTINLILMQRKRMVRELQRTEADDNHETAGMYFKHFFHLKSTTSISRQGLSVLIETYNSEIAKLNSEVSKSINAVYIPEKLLQIVKAMSLSLAYVETSQIHDSINLLLSLKPKSKENIVRNYQDKGNQVLDYNKIIDPDTFDKGRFNVALEKLTSAVFALVDAYCKAFDTDFAVRNPQNGQSSSPRKAQAPTERISSGSIEDNFTLTVASVHRLPPDWKKRFDYFEVECGLYYGGSPLCLTVLTKLSKPVKGFFEHIRWDKELRFGIPIKDIPRETRLCMALYGLNSPRKQTSETKNRVELGWIGVNLFNFKGLLISGTHLFGLISGTEMNPAAACSNNIQEQTSVVLKADFEVYHTEVIFRETLVQPTSTVNNIACPSDIPPKLDDLINQGLCRDFTKSQREMIWENRLNLSNIPQALSFVLKSIPDFSIANLTNVQDLLSVWKPLLPNMAIKLLKADFPDILVRQHAVKHLSTVSEDDLCDYLPQLVQALKYESYHNSALAMYLIKSSLHSPRIAHYLFWHLKYYIADAQFSQRFQIVLGGILSVCGTSMRDQLSREDQMIQLLARTAKNVKEASESLRGSVLNDELEIVATEIDGCLRLPVNPATKVKSLNISNCSYFNSFTVPLSLDFANADPRGHSVKFMFKVGDDLRKDLITLQLFRVMNKLWLSEGLDLKMVTYECMPTSPMAGMIELVQEAFTLREIHVQHGVTGSFKDDVIALWLQKFNQTLQYKKAVDNFSASCAAYCVATYILGIGDRHNDNIMVTKRGHLFHIDFNKFLGNTQKFGTIRRDRVPFVLTPDMAYVINSGDTMSRNFQHFVELCCEAFNVIRKNADLILNLLGLMVSSGIAYLSTTNDLDYVQHALQLPLSDAEATGYFTRLIETSLSSKSTQLNFFIHNVAHLKDSNASACTASVLFSFSNKVHSRESDGEIVSVRCVDIQKRYVPDKHYIFVLNLLRANKSGPTFIFRKYDEFQELHTKLSNVFGASNVPALPSRIIVGRSEIREVATRRRYELDDYLVELAKHDNISKSEILYTFLHSYMRDEQDSQKFSDILFRLDEGMPKSRVGGEIKLSYRYENGSFSLLVMHARNLISRTVQGLADPYVKSYLLPDPKKLTKRKTRVARKNLNPTYNQKLTYSMSFEELQQRVLQVTVWDHDPVGVNGYLGGVNCYLSTHDITHDTTQWYELKDIGFGT
eukprot:gene18694-20582_t